MHSSESECLCPENEPCSYRGMNNLVGKSGAGEVIEALTAAMSQDQIGGINLPECRDDLLNVIIVERGHDMEAASSAVPMTELPM